MRLDEQGLSGLRRAVHDAHAPVRSHPDGQHEAPLALGDVAVAQGALQRVAPQQLLQPGADAPPQRSHPTAQPREVRIALAAEATGLVEGPLEVRDQGARQLDGFGQGDQPRQGQLPRVDPATEPRQGRQTPADLPQVFGLQTDAPRSHRDEGTDLADAPQR